MEVENNQNLKERCKIVVWMDQFLSPEIVQLKFKKEFNKIPPNRRVLEDLYQLFMNTGSVWKNKSRNENQDRILIESRYINGIKPQQKSDIDSIKIKLQENEDEMCEEVDESSRQSEDEADGEDDDDDETEEKKTFEWVTLLKGDEDPESLGYAEINVDEGDEFLQLNDVANSYSCLKCSFTTSDYCLFESHEKAHSARDYFKCSKCFFTSNNTNLFRSHQKGCKGRRDLVIGAEIDDGDGDSDVKCHTCDQCGKAYSSLSSLKMHKAYHSKLRPFACDKCDYRFFSEKTLKKHSITHDKIKHLECPHCSYKCNLSGNMIIHARTHTGEKPYTCTECPYRTGNPSIIKRHLATHRKEVSYRCRKCNYKTHKRYLLENHEKSHTTESQFKCYVCQEELRNAYALRYHMTKQHSEQEVLECPFCDFRQKDKSLLKIHIRRHTGEKPYGCPDERCNFRAMRSQDLKRHLTKCSFLNGT